MKSLVLFLSIFSAHNVWSYVGSVSAGTGNSGRASIEASDTPFTTAAGLAYLKGYFFSSGLSTYKGGKELGLSITENMRDTIVPTAISYVQKDVDPGLGQKISSKDFQLAVAGMATQKASVGLAYVYHTDRRTSAELGEENFIQNAMNFSILMAPIKQLGIVYGLDNIRLGSSKAPTDLKLVTRSVLGLAYNYQEFMRLKGDVKTDSDHSLRNPTYSTGIENFLNKWIIARLGYEVDRETSIEVATAGIGFSLPKFTLNYAFQRAQTEPKEDRHGIDLSIPIW